MWWRQQNRKERAGAAASVVFTPEDDCPDSAPRPRPTGLLPHAETFERATPSLFPTRVLCPDCRSVASLTDKDTQRQQQQLIPESAFVSARRHLSLQHLRPTRERHLVLSCQSRPPRCGTSPRESPRFPHFSPSAPLTRLCPPAVMPFSSPAVGCCPRPARATAHWLLGAHPQHIY